MYSGILCALFVILIIIVIIWAAYSVSAAYQQTLTTSLAFEGTYRHVPNLNKERKYKMDSIEITVAGTLKKDVAAAGTISPGSRIKDIVRENIIDPYRNCLLIQEAQTFVVKEEELKRCPLVKNPTVENLAVLFFNKLATIMPKIGTQLVSVTIVSEDMKCTHSRYKASNYSV